MDILDPRTLAVLRDKNVQDAMNEILKDGASASKTVDLVDGNQNLGRGRDSKEPKKVTVRRVA